MQAIILCCASGFVLLPLAAILVITLPEDSWANAPSRPRPSVRAYILLTGLLAILFKLESIYPRTRYVHDSTWPCLLDSAIIAFILVVWRLTSFSFVNLCLLIPVVGLLGFSLVDLH